MKQRCSFRHLFVAAAVAGLAVLLGCESSSTSDDADSQAGNPPADDSAAALQASELTGTWSAPGEAVGTDTVTYSFNLQGGGAATYTKETTGSQTGMAISTPGSWVLSGTTLILASPMAEMNGSGTVVGKAQVTINGRSYNKQ